VVGDYRCDRIAASAGFSGSNPELAVVSDDPEYDVNFREHPEQYEIGRGSEGAFKIQPYKDELLDHWTVSDLAAARQGAAAIYDRFLEYRADDDFVGMDMARKYLRMGYTRAMRYAKYPGGRKYDDDGTQRTPQEYYDEEKREIALIYEEYWQQVRNDERYQERKRRHRDGEDR
jgi:hypothetical protein